MDVVGHSIRPIIFHPVRFRNWDKVFLDTLFLLSVLLNVCFCCSCCNFIEQILVTYCLKSKCEFYALYIIFWFMSIVFPFPVPVGGNQISCSLSLMLLSNFLYFVFHSSLQSTVLTLKQVFPCPVMESFESFVSDSCTLMTCASHVKLFIFALNLCVSKSPAFSTGFLTTMPQWLNM